MKWEDDDGAESSADASPNSASDSTEPAVGISPSQPVATPGFGALCWAAERGEVMSLGKGILGFFVLLLLLMALYVGGAWLRLNG